MTQPLPATTCRVRVGLGTLIAIEVSGGEPCQLEIALAAAMACIQRVEAAMHPTRSGSDLCALAAAAPGTAVRVDPWTVEVLRLAQLLHRESGGVFDPCLPGFGGRLQDLRLLGLDTVLATTQLRIDLGGIAKGYAVDRAVAAMQAAGCHSGLINAGGDARAFGDSVFLMDCRAADTSQRIELRNGAVAVSSADAVDRPPEHQGYYLRRQDETLPALAAFSRRHAVVLAPTAAIADALTKCLMLAAPEQSAALLQCFDARALPL